MQRQHFSGKSTSKQQAEATPAPSRRASSRLSRAKVASAPTIPIIKKDQVDFKSSNAQNIVGHFQLKARDFLDRLGEEIDVYNGDLPITNLRKPLLQFLKDKENFNPAFYNNVPGGDYVYFANEVTKELKKNWCFPQTQH